MIAPGPPAQAERQNEASVPKVTYRRQGQQDYQVWVGDRFIGLVWKAHRSSWYCSAGNAGFGNRTRKAATRLLLELSHIRGRI